MCQFQNLQSIFKNFKGYDQKQTDYFASTADAFSGIKSEKNIPTLNTKRSAFPPVFFF